MSYQGDSAQFRPVGGLSSIYDRLRTVSAISKVICLVRYSKKMFYHELYTTGYQVDLYSCISTGLRDDWFHLFRVCDYHHKIIKFLFNCGNDRIYMYGNFSFTGALLAIHRCTKNYRDQGC